MTGKGDPTFETIFLNDLVRFLGYKFPDRKKVKTWFEVDPQHAFNEFLKWYEEKNNEEFQGDSGGISKVA